jgi:phosphocarrier protein
MFVSVSQRFLSEIKVSKEMDGEETVVNGKSIMGLMMLAAAFGEKVKVVVSGPDEGEAMAHIEALFSKKFDED